MGRGGRDRKGEGWMGRGGRERKRERGKGKGIDGSAWIFV